MTREQAQETAQLIREELNKLGKYDPRPTMGWHFRGDEMAGVELWMINPKAGNRTLHVVEDYAPELVGAHVRTVIGKASKRDKAALARIAAEKENS